MSGSGEGSRGGKVTGHTASGKPIYGDAKSRLAERLTARGIPKEKHHLYTDKKYQRETSVGVDALGNSLRPGEESKRAWAGMPQTRDSVAKKKRAEELGKKSIADEGFMFTKAMPSLLETIEDSGAIKDTIEKGCLDSGRIKMGDDDFGKGMSFILEVGQREVDPAEACLTNTHGEQFHSDADSEVVNYLTTVEKVDLKNSPVHNPAGAPGPHQGFPKTQKSVSDALDVIEKGFPKPLPPKPSLKAKKPPKDPEQIKQEKEQEKDLGFKKSGFDRDALMAKAFNWGA